MDLHLSGKTAVVTGASKDIGLAIARALPTTSAPPPSSAAMSNASRTPRPVGCSGRPVTPTGRRPPPPSTTGTCCAVGREQLHLAHHANHSPDNIFIYAPEHATLMVVDVLYPGWVPFKNLAVSQEIPGWVRAQRVAMKYPWTTLVGGHLGRLGTRADADIQQWYVADLERKSKVTLAALDPAPFFAKYLPTGNAWAIFKAYLDEAARQIADPVVAAYAGQLAAVDVFTVDNAFAMLESQRIDAGVLGPFGIRP